MNIQNNNKNKYKTMLCRHFETSKGCVYKDKCQFAHGSHELQLSNNSIPEMQMQLNPNIFAQQIIQQSIPNDFVQGQQKKIPNPQNYKIVKCKNFEKDGHCKYEGYCSFAHGDMDLRKKNDNNFMQQIPINPMMQMYPQYIPQELGMMYNPYQIGAIPQAMDLSQIYGFPQQYQGMSNMQNMNFGMPFGNESVNINPNENKDQESYGGNSNLSNLNTINNIYPQKYQK